MKTIIENTINWTKIGKHSKSDYQYVIEKAVVSKETAVLSVSIRLNFIFPYKDRDRISSLITNDIQGLRGVSFDFIYENVILTEEEIFKLYIPYMIEDASEQYGVLTKTIFPKEFIYLKADKSLTIMALGDLAVSELNDKVAKLFEALLKEHFQLDLDVKFENHHENYKEIVKERKAKMAQEIVETEKLRAEALAAVKASPNAAPVSGGNSFSAGNGGGNNGGNGNGGGWKRREKETPMEGNRIMGKNNSDRAIPIGEITSDSGTVTIEGMVFKLDSRTINNSKKLVTLLVTDKTTSICVKAFVSENKWNEISENIKPGSFVKVRGNAEWDTYENMVTIMMKDLEKTEIEKRKDNAPIKRVELHAHTKMSAMDGLAEAKDLVKTAAAWGHRAVAVTDHGVVQSFPEAAKTAKYGKLDIKVIYGVEGYLYDDLDQISHMNECESSGEGEPSSQGKVNELSSQGVEKPSSQGEVKEFSSQGVEKPSSQGEVKEFSSHGVEKRTSSQKKDKNETHKIDYKSKGTNHIVILAQTQEGLKNLYKLISLSHLHYFYKKPRIPKSLLMAHREGLLLGSACEAGEVYGAIAQRKPREEILKIASFYDYLEIQPLSNNIFLVDRDNSRDPGKPVLNAEHIHNMEDLKNVNRDIVNLGKELGKLVVATCDAHYIDHEDALYRKILMAGQGYTDADRDQHFYLRTTEEMLEEFQYLGRETAEEVVIHAPNRIADMIDSLYPVPQGKFPPKIDDADRLLREKCEETAKSIYGDPLPDLVRARMDRELNSIINNGYAVMYVSAEMLVQKSLSDGYLVGSRGSVGSSFAATMGGITEVNPLPPHYICPNTECKNSEFILDGSYDCGVDLPDKVCPKCGTEYKRDGFNIPFEVFLGFEGDKEPDIDLNFAGEYQPVAHKYVEEIFGRENVFRAGTIGTIAEKTAFGFVMKYFEQRQMPVNKYEVDRLAVSCSGVRRTTGQHPGGIIIVPRGHEIYEFCPVQHPANDTSTDIITTHFDYHSIDENLLKLDILGHDVPSMIRHLQDMTGVDPLDVPLRDGKVNSIFNGVEGLDIKDPEYTATHGSYGIPEFGTKFVRQMLDDTNPSKFADLVRISGFSHGTDVWINNAQEFIKSGQATITDAISTRDDIMNYLIQKGVPNKAAFKIMENVRKGKGVKDDEVALMEENNVPEWYIESCRRIKYMFPKAHAVAYVMMSYRIAYYKVYHPLEFYAVYFTTKAADFNDDVILKGAKSIKNRIAMIEAMGKNATKKEQDEITVLEVAAEMYARGFSFLQAELGKSHATKFLVYESKVLLPFIAISGVGESAANAIVAEFEKKPFLSVDDMKVRAKANKTAVEALQLRGVIKDLPESDQLSLF